eukprot:CAMPEP_0185029112 /NCGR_PEP_ID=MMETSP1103-20130426/15221_1 /TAXON_ID=36769 /ORGANISM="Paraphysomonas bandaiensis, Strain Caron Lab Isolate" /LENGTH=315 /DNA_ID=CAMNT_0027563733 /DNA_START=34 /DNA_END=978 /DNA_ORIENTATION=+
MSGYVPPSTKIWAPNDSYKLTLKEISEQLTPSGIYRHRLATTGREERFLRRLEWRWERRFERWTWAATTVKAAYRGMLGRRYFKSIRKDLELKKMQREAKSKAIEAFRSGDRDKTLEILGMVDEMNGELYIVKAKVLYKLEEFEQSAVSAKLALSTPSMEADARFIMANCYIKLNRYLDAFDELNLLSILGDTRIDSRRLRAYVAAKLSPPNYDDGIEVMTGIVDDYPEDLNMILHRALIYCCQQDFTAAIEDFNTILKFQPELDMVLLLRARALCCVRRWNRALLDYESVLSRDPDNSIAKEGIRVINDPILEL